MILKVRATINKYNMIVSGDKVFAAVSGGADSVCLLLVLKELSDEMRFCLEVIHVEHGIRGAESIEDAKFVKDLCKKLDVRCHIYHIDVPSYSKEHKLSTEEAARLLRYECFDKHTADGKIAIAHNMDDNAETIVYNMVRGTGIEGIRGIKKVRGSYIRPLIECSRQDINRYLSEREQAFRTDSTNKDTDYTRNNIRHNIIPRLTDVNPGAVAHLSKLSNLQDMAVEYINKQADKIYDKYVTGNRVLKELLNEELIIVQTVIHRFLNENANTAKDIQSHHIEDVCDLLKGDAGRRVNLPYGMMAIAEYDSVRIVRDKKEGLEPVIINDIGDGFEMDVAGFFVRLSVRQYEPEQEIPSKTYTKMIDYDKITNGLSVRNRQGGDYLIVNATGNKKSLSRYMIDEKIPVLDRDSMPLFCDGNHVIYVVGHRISEYYKIGEDTKRVLVIEVISDTQGEYDE